MNDFIAQSAALRKKLLTLFILITVMLSGSFHAHGVGYHEHFMFIDENGSLWAMGLNDDYQLGNGNVSNQYNPILIYGSDVVQVATGYDTSLFIKNDGSLWGMGLNSNYQLGLNNNGHQSSPVQIVASDVVQVASGYYHTMFLKTDGSVWAMGYDDWGQFGTGTYNNTFSNPTKIIDGNVSQIAANQYHSLFIKNDGSLWGMGYNYQHLLGVGASSNEYSSPQEIVASDVVSVVAGHYRTFYIKSDGSLWGMGDNSDRELGLSSLSSYSSPTQIISSGVVQVSTGADHSVFLKDDGSLWGMGHTDNGELGQHDGSNHLPFEIVNSGVVQIQTAWEESYYIDGNGSLWGTGHNNHGELGLGHYSEVHSFTKIRNGGVVSLVNTAEIVSLNSAPSDILLPVSTLPENLPAGTVVGQLSAVDPDDVNATGSYSFSLVSGAGDSDNAQFTIDAGGTLSVNGTTDYESMIADPNATYVPHTDLNSSFANANYPANYFLTPRTQYPAWSIRVEVQDENNASFEKILLIASLDRDDTAPVITLGGNPTVSHVVASAYTDGGATWTDEVDGNGSITATGNVDVMVPGTYTLSYDVTDAAGNAATQAQRVVTVVNRNPDSISIDQNLLEENYPIGSIIGNLSATDPDDPQNGHTYTYQLLTVDGVAPFGFAISNAGNVSTSQSFDFELQQTYILDVRVEDAFGGSYDQSITITLVDAFVPYVETVSAGLEANHSLVLSGKVVDEGGTSGILDTGFLISELPIVEHNQSGIQKISALLDANQSFAIVHDANVSGTRIYICAYAETAEGINLGLEEVVDIPKVSTPSLWATATAVAGAPAWWESDWFGTYYNGVESGWILHSGLGWLYPSPSDNGGVWLWKENMGWLWTDSDKFPYLYSETNGAWMYYYGTVQQKRLFFDYGNGEWITLDESTTDESEGSR